MRDKSSFNALIRSLNRSRNHHAVRLTIERNLTDPTLSADQRSILEQHLLKINEEPPRKAA